MPSTWLLYGNALVLFDEVCRHYALCAIEGQARLAEVAVASTGDERRPGGGDLQGEYRLIVDFGPAERSVIVDRCAH
jgi:hypothetical protein